MRPHIKHGGNPVCCFSDIVAEAVDIRLNEVCLGDDFLFGITLHTHQRRKFSQVADENIVIGQHHKVAIFVHAIQGMGSSVPRIEDSAGRHILIPVSSRFAVIRIHQPNVIVAGHWCSIAGKLLRALSAPVLVIDFTGFQQSRHRHGKDVLAERIGVAGYDGIISVYLQYTYLCLIDAVLYHLVDAALHIGVVENMWFNHQCLYEVIFHAADILFVQPCAFEKQNGFCPIGIQHILYLIHCWLDELLHICVIQFIALDELIVQCSLTFQLSGTGLRHAEGITVAETILHIVIAAVIGVPQLQHGCCQYQFHIPHIHIVTPCVLDNVSPCNILGEVQKVKGKYHTLLP